MAENGGGYSRHRPEDRGLRASDADRDAISDILRREHGAGRLDTDEFAERYGLCLQARTYAELDELIADFPTDTEPAPAARARSFGRGSDGDRTANRTWRRAGRAGWPVPVFAWLALVLVIAAASRGHLLWIAFPLFFLFVVRPLIWRSRGWDRRGWDRSGWGPWGCRGAYRRQETTAL
jgi:Domain of unknown function (DUF1707)